MIKPFKVDISEEILQNIYSKVKNYPWDDMPNLDGWDHGSNIGYMKEISNYWLKEFNWRKTEEKINKFTGLMNLFWLPVKLP